MTTQREHWGSKLGFLLATAGSAIGLGSFWKFPYVTGNNGGGAFIVVFILFTIIIGIPLLIAELIIGRAAQRSPAGAFTFLSSQVDSHWKMLSWSCFIIIFLIITFYSVVSGWSLNYTLLSLLNFTQGKTEQEIRQVFDIMYTSPSLNIFWHFIFILLTTSVVYKGVRKGIEQLSKAVAPLFLVIIVSLVLYACSLPGAKQAFAFLFELKWNELSPSAILQALGLSCFTLSVGMGIIITYGSYMKNDSDIPKLSVYVSIINILISIMAALLIFPIIFSFGGTPEAGPGLLFQTMPVLFSKLPATLLISTTFFLLIVFTALTSAISVMETLVAIITEKFSWSRQKAAAVLGIAVFICGIPSAGSGSNLIFPEWKSIYGIDFFSTLNELIDIWLLPINSLLIVLFAGWWVSQELKRKQFAANSALAPFYFLWNFLIRYIVPLAILIIILENGKLISLDWVSWPHPNP